MLGKTVSHYVIEEELGRGGMGVVYKARDTSLDRYVALKFLPPYLTQDEEARTRFVREAKAAAGVDHPSICTIHEIGETDDGRTYIVMAYYGGDTLDDFILRGAVDIDTAVDIALQVAEGLASAHEKGIVHRDIKPGNIVISDKGEVKILDFGLAKLAGDVNLTKPGSTTGTAAYMAPEQIRGEEADERADIWSLGVVLHEMLSGSRPFSGAYEQAVSYAILNQEPPALTDQRPDVPGWLSDLTEKMLAKDSEARPTSIAEVATVLRAGGTGSMAPLRRKRSRESHARSILWVAALVIFAIIVAAALLLGRTPDKDSAKSGTTEAQLKSLAVLPLSNLRSDPETNYLGYALADQVIGALDYFRSLSVRPSSSIRPYQDRRVDAVTAGEELEVDYVLSGTYLKEDEQVRLTVELVDVATNKIEWREPISVSYENTFQLQDIVSKKVIDGLRLQFSTEEVDRSRTDTPRNPLAYELYLRSIAQPSTIEGRRIARELLLQSIALDSLYAPAWDALGLRVRRAEIFGGTWQNSTPASEYFDRALELNPNLLSALVNKAVQHTDRGQLDDAYTGARRVLEINSSSVLGHFVLGYVYRYAGLLELSVAEMDTAIGIDPTNRLLRSAVGTYYQAGIWEKAVRAAQIDRGSSYELTWTTAVRIEQGRIDDAIRLAMKTKEIDPESFEAQWAEQQIAVATGSHESGLAASARIDAMSPEDSEIWFWQSMYYSALGDIDKSIWALETAVNSGYSAWIPMESHRFLLNAREDPRFSSVLARAKKRSDAFRQRHIASS